MNEIFEEVVLAIEEGLYSVINRPDVVLLILSHWSFSYSSSESFFGAR